MLEAEYILYYISGMDSDVWEAAAEHLPRLTKEPEDRLRIHELKYYDVILLALVLYLSCLASRFCRVSTMCSTLLVLAVVTFLSCSKNGNVACM